jgi:MFS family permease
LFLTYALVSLVIRIFGAKLPERLGPRRSVTSALVSMAGGLAVFAAAPNVISLWIRAFLIGLWLLRTKLAHAGSNRTERKSDIQLAG